MELPRDNLVRAVQPGLELRDDSPDAPPTLVGHFAVFNQWTEINSAFEGRFMERIAPGAFAKTFQENRHGMRVLFNHGHDPQIGDKVLGPIENLSEDNRGASYEVPLLDTSYNADLLPGLRAGLYGSSFRFKVMKEEIDSQPKRSATNPEGLPERTITEAMVREFGPVTFPAYEGATSGIRSLTDRYMQAQNGTTITTTTTIADPADETTTDMTLTTTVVTTEATRALPDDGADDGHSDEGSRQDDALADDGAGTGHSDTASRERQEEPQEERNEPMSVAENAPVSEIASRQTEIKNELLEIHQQYGTALLPTDVQERWEALEREQHELEQRVKQYELRMRTVERTASAPSNLEDERGFTGNLPKPRRVPSDVFAVQEYRNYATSIEEVNERFAEGSKRALDDTSFPHPDADEAKCKEHVAKLIDRDHTGEVARRILETGSPAYRRAFGKYLAGIARTQEEERVLSLTNTAGGYAVAFQLDPTVILTSNGVVNPIRAISRVETITTNEWRGVASAGSTASYVAESTEASDNSPTFTQPVCFPERAQWFVPFSREIGDDWASLESEMARLLQDAKDTLEATKFVTGLGHASTEPQGFLVGGTAIVTTAGTAALAVADLYSLEEALPPRFRPRASFVGNKFVFNKVRQLDTAGGANLWVRLDSASPPELIGYNAYELSSMAAALTSGGSILTIGDFSNFLILDRIGMSVEVIPHLFATANNRPSGQRGLYAYWRNSSQVLAWQAFRTLKTL